jgi:hypothetical protein
MATTGVALAKRTRDLLATQVLPKPDPFVAKAEPGFTSLFDGTAKTFKNWRLAGPGGGGMAHLDGEMVSYGDGGLRLFYYAVEAFANFTLRLQFRIFDLARHNSGVFVRFPQPSLDFATAELDRRAKAEPVYSGDNIATKPIITGFEVQIDDTAAGDSTKSFYGITPEPNGLYKNRTGAIYKIQAGDRIWHLNTNEPAIQQYTPGPPLVPGHWFEYEIDVNGDTYVVKLTDLDTGASTVTSRFTNTDVERGRAPGFIGIQVYPGSTLAWRHVRIRKNP